MIIPKDKIFLVSSGEYSDYMVHCILKAKKDLDMDVITREWASTYKQEEASIEGVAFDTYLLKHQYADEIDYMEIHQDWWGEKLAVSGKLWEPIEEIEIDGSPRARISGPIKCPEFEEKREE